MYSIEKARQIEYQSLGMLLQLHTVEPVQVKSEEGDSFRMSHSENQESSGQSEGSIEEIELKNLA